MDEEGLFRWDRAMLLVRQELFKRVPVLVIRLRGKCIWNGTTRIPFEVKEIINTNDPAEGRTRYTIDDKKSPPGLATCYSIAK